MTNRYIINGLTDEAAHGKRVLYLAGNHYEVREAMDEALRQDIPAANFTTSHGRERILIGRGHIDLRTTYNVRDLRGTVYDLVYVDPDAERTLRDTIHDLHAIVAATQGEIIRA
jgi:hypothetical protein